MNHRKFINHLISRIAGKPIVIVLPAIACFVFFLYNSLLSSNYEKARGDVNKYVSQWEMDLSQNISEKTNPELIRKIFSGLKVFPLSQYELRAQEECSTNGLKKAIRRAKDFQSHALTLLSII